MVHLICVYAVPPVFFVRRDFFTQNFMPDFFTPHFIWRLLQYFAAFDDVDDDGGIFLFGNMAMSRRKPSGNVAHCGASNGL